MTARRALALALAGGLAAAVLAAPAALPAALAALVRAARIDAVISQWCPVDLGHGRAPAYAVAVASPGGGRYLVLGGGGPAIELGRFAGPAELSCSTPAEARRLDAAIRTSETLHGGIEPVGPSTVVCGFVEQTRALCWQYAPAVRRFVEVGDWMT